MPFLDLDLWTSSFIVAYPGHIHLIFTLYFILLVWNAVAVMFNLIKTRSSHS